MPAPTLDEYYPESPIPSYGSGMSLSYPVAVTRYFDGSEQRLRLSDGPLLKLNLTYVKLNMKNANIIRDFYKRAGGKYHTFRVRPHIIQYALVSTSNDSLIMRFDQIDLNFSIEDPDSFNLNISLTEVN